MVVSMAVLCLSCYPISFLINSHGEIARVFENARPAEHSAEILETLKNLSF